MSEGHLQHTATLIVALMKCVREKNETSEWASISAVCNCVSVKDDGSEKASVFRTTFSEEEEEGKRKNENK